MLWKMKVGGEKTSYLVHPLASRWRAAHQEAHLNYSQKVHKQRVTGLLRKILCLSHLLSVHLRSSWWLILTKRIWEANLDLILMPLLFSSAQHESVACLCEHNTNKKEKVKKEGCYSKGSNTYHQLPSFHQCHPLPQSRFGVSSG